MSVNRKCRMRLAGNTPAVTWSLLMLAMIIGWSPHAIALQPLADLDAAALQQFTEGRKEFSARWVTPFLSGGHWGRGPQSNADACSVCHQSGGRGRAPDGPEEPPQSLVLRLSMPGTDARGRPRAHHTYGTTLNQHGVLGQLVEEGDFRIEYTTQAVALAGGDRVTLRKPVIHLTALWYGPIGNDTIVSLRLAQPVFGLGLLEAISEATLQAIAREQQELGFNGRLNVVLDETSGTRKTGRFGHKASQPDLRQQVAVAFHDEIGVTSSIYPREQCSPAQKPCDLVEHLEGVEARERQLDLIAAYLRLLAPPAQRNRDDAQVSRGAELFDSARCSVCHRPEIKTAADAHFAPLRNRVIHPYTDLLLHDMGEGLADGRREFDAGARDWRTPPLWGVGLRRQTNGNASLLHDGRARNITEAILWHQGEAELSRRSFLAMSEQEREALVRFVNSL
ncbi:MAG: di-heme oxidoredictase family protein [Burkholderiales bacterium]